MINIIIKTISTIKNFNKKSNLVDRYIEEYSLISSSEETIGSQHIYDIFVRFCKKSGELPISKQVFENELKKLNFQEERKAT